MTPRATTELLPAPTALEAGPPPRPRLRSIIARLGASLWVSIVVPALLFTVTFAVFGTTVALIVALVWFYAAVAWRRVTGQRSSGLLALMVVVMTVRTAFTLVTGNTFVYFLQPVIADAVVALVFLVSLATARPVVARLAADFYPMDDEVAARHRIRRLFWRLTLMWALVCLVKGGVSFYLLESQSLINFVIVKNAVAMGLTVAAVVATVWASVRVARQEGLFAPA
jgi:intracellular septation protein A